MKLFENSCFVLIFILLNHLNVSFGQQHAIGFTSGYNAGTFLNFSKQEDFDTKYKLKSGFSLTSFYETRNNTAVSFRLGLNYSYQKANMNVNQFAGHYSTFTNMDYSFHLLDFNLNLVFHLIEKEKFKMNLLFGPTFNSILNTRAKGEGWNN